MAKKVSKIIAVLLSAVILLCSTGVAFADEAVSADRHGITSHPGKLVTLDDVAAPAKRKSAAKSGTLSTTKTMPFLVIVVGLSNLAYEDSVDWSDKIFCGDESLQQYYTDMSFGQFTFVPASETSQYGTDGNTNTADSVNDGIVHVNLDMEHDNWVDDTDASYKSMYNMFSSAVNAADSYVDFSTYDYNGNGKVENNEMALGFVVAGYEGSESEELIYGINNYLWAHAWDLGTMKMYYPSLAPVPQPDGVKVGDYIAISEQFEDHTIAPISIFAHELGHYLGLPDLYDTTYATTGEYGIYDVAYLSTMCGGEWGTDKNGDYIPYSLDIWSRCMLGWVTPTEVTADGAYAVNAQNFSGEDNFNALKIPINDHEYYLIENRQFTKWDEGMSAFYSSYSNGGIIVWHIDNAVYEKYESSNSVNNSSKHRPAVMPIYPERSDGVLTFIGSEKLLAKAYPFYDNAFWTAKFSHIEGGMDLPAYGTGENADIRSARTYSGIKLQFLDDSAQEMSVRVTFPKKDGYSLTVDSGLGMNLYLDIDKYIMSDRTDGATVEITYNSSDESNDAGEKTDTYAYSEIADLRQSDGTYLFTVRQAPAQIADDVTVKITDGVGDTVFTTTTSVAEYCIAVAESSASTDKLKALGAAIYDYGRAASEQAYANGQYTEGHGTFTHEYFNDLTVDATVDAEAYIDNKKVGAYYFNNLSYNATATPSLRVYTNLTEVQAAQLGDDGLRVNPNGNVCKVIDGILPEHFNTCYTVTLGDSECKLNVLAYAKLAGTTQPRVQTGIYNYYKAAKNYFA